MQSGIPATAPGKAQAAKDAGALVMQLVRDNKLPSQILTHTAFRNAIAAVAATGGSTNAVLHLVAIADELGLELPLEEFDAISEATPVVADLKPVGASSRPICTTRAACRCSPVSSCAAS